MRRVRHGDPRVVDNDPAMPKLSRQGVVVCSLLLVGSASYWVLSGLAGQRPVHAGFWFEDVTFAAPELGGALTSADMAVIASVARAELTQAFSGLRVMLSDRRDATYGVRVVQEVRDLRFRRNVGVAGQSRAVNGLGGQGSVNFSLLANSAVGYASTGASRASIVEAIGRGVGRGAVHEFTHQFLPTAPIHATTDSASFEFASAARREQYYGDMHWDLAWPLLQQRLGLADAASMVNR